MAIKIKRVTNANVYINGTSLLGIVDEISVPDIKAIMTEHKALGMVGKLEFASGIDKLEAKIKWNSFDETAYAAMAAFNKFIPMSVYADRMSFDSTGLTIEDRVTIAMTVAPKNSQGGSFKQHETVEIETMLNVIYMRVEMGGVAILEFDAMANIYKVNGIDQFAQYRANIGQ